MRVWRLPAWLSLFAAAVFAAPAAGAGDEKGKSEAAAVVEMTDKLTFRPETVTIRAGERVKWINVSRVRHTVTADPEKASRSDSVALPEGAAPFDSGFINAEASYTQTFTTPGRYVYFCIPHAGPGMIGEVIVDAG